MTGPRTRPATAQVSPWAVAALGAAGAATAAAVWGIGIERHLFTVRRREVAVLPSGSAPLRVLHLADAHMAPWQHRKARWIARLAEREQPDLVINTGDNLGHTDALAALRRAFEPLRGVPGLFVHGSNDVIAPKVRNPFGYLAGPSQRHREPATLDTEAMDAWFTDQLGWTALNNTAARLTVCGIRLDAFGVDDAHNGWDELEAIPDAIAGLRPRRATPDLTLGVTHAPYRRVLDRFAELGADMVFAGHTHGGQVRVPFSPSALVANCDVPLDQARGLSSWSAGDRTIALNVSAGLGHSIFAPVRFGCVPEASILTLRPAPEPVGDSATRR
ncbi:metallophosphoesterase [Microbacterium sp.]|uniref:metallophosphoesterase n=1 Tax=Microbacterium sp. TaxID=51671 RepID=UPI003A851898